MPLGIAAVIATTDSSSAARRSRCDANTDVYAGLGDNQIALEWFENALDRGFTNYAFLAEYDPFVEGLRGTPEFEDFLERVKDAWERFEV